MKTDKNRTVDYGFNYLPTIDLVEDFSPYWIKNNLKIEIIKRDLLTMRALNMRFVRFHIIPANPARDPFPGIDIETFNETIIESIRYAHTIGLKAHIDIWSENIMNITENEVQRLVSKLKGVVNSYQIGNETYFIWKKSDDAYKHIAELIKAGRAEDPAAKFSIDIFCEDLENLKNKFPEIYEMLDMNLIHYYSMDDITGWTDVYIEELIYHCGGTKSTKTIDKNRYVPREFYNGSYGFSQKEKWLTEFTAAGYHRFAGQTSETLKAKSLEVLCRELVNKTELTVIGHHCFRDKMSWREFGQSQCGMINIDGSPKTSVFAFQKMARISLPGDDLSKWVETKLAIDDQILTVSIENKSDKKISGTIKIEVSPEIKLATERIIDSLDISPGKTKELNFKITDASSKATSHIHALFTAKAWGSASNTSAAWLCLEKRVPLQFDATTPVFSGVKYNDNTFNDIIKFFESYDEIAIITGNLSGFDMEMAYRLKCVINAKTGIRVHLAATVNAREFLDKPLIVIGNPQNDYYARLIESMESENHKISIGNKAFIKVIKEPFKFRERFGTIAKATGFLYSPAAIYIAAIDDNNMKAAVYDLIKRIWVDDYSLVSLSSNAVSFISRGFSSFRTDVDPGPYRITVTYGDISKETSMTICINGKKYGPYLSNNEIKSTTIETTASNSIILQIGNADGLWALREIEIAHTGLLAEYRNFLFSQKKTDILQSGNKNVVLENTNYSASSGFGWLPL